MEATSVVMKNKRQNVAGSLKTKIPIRTVPTAPIPVHTGYAVPIGRFWVALASSPILAIVKMTNPHIQNHHSEPETSFARPRQYVNPISQQPATIKIIQFMINKILLRAAAIPGVSF